MLQTPIAEAVTVDAELAQDDLATRRDLQTTNDFLRRRVFNDCMARWKRMISAELDRCEDPLAVARKFGAVLDTLDPRREHISNAGAPPAIRLFTPVHRPTATSGPHPLVVAAATLSEETQQLIHNPAVVHERRGRPNKKRRIVGALESSQKKSSTRKGTRATTARKRASVSA